MWRRLSLRARLNLLCALLLALALGINVGALVVGAAARVDAEIASSMRLSTEFVEAALANLHGNAEMDRALDRLVASMQNLRHVQIYRERPGGDGAHEPPHRVRRVPQWFAAVIHPVSRQARIAALVDGHEYGRIVIASYPYDEMNEVWDDARSLAAVGTALVTAVFALTFRIVDRSLVPIRELGAGLTRLSRGDYATRIRPSGPPEFIDIGTRLNSLSETLERAEGENRRLVQKLISVQDDERKQLARELHDEFGAHLFAIRANMTSLVKASGSAKHDPERFAATSRAILGLVDALQRLNRRILGRLRPMALGELGLADAVRGLAAMWSGAHPEVAVTLDLPDALDGLDEALGLAVYRVVQESLTNVFRHARASAVHVVVDYADDGTEPPGALHLLVRDNGVGAPASAKPGLGQLGMRERIRGLGGSLSIGEAPDGGVIVEARVPIVPPARSAAE